MGGRKIDANICLSKKELFPKTRFRIVLCFKHLKTFYWSSASPLGKRGPRVRPAARICPNNTRGKNQCFFPLAAPLFPFATVGPRSHLWWGRLRADGQMPALSASMACFICPGLFWAARRARFGAWAAERRDKNAYSIKYADLIYYCSVAHAPNLT